MDKTIVNQIIGKLTSFSSRIDRQMMLIQKLQGENAALLQRIEALEKAFEGKSQN